MHEAVTSGERFNYIVAAHVIEHVTDIVALLDTAQRLLEPGGQLSLIVPDKRYCFDRMRPVTTVGQVVEAHLDPDLFHGPAPFIDTHLYTVRRFATGNTWDAHSGTDLAIPVRVGHGPRHDQPGAPGRRVHRHPPLGLHARLWNSSSGTCARSATPIWKSSR